MSSKLKDFCVQCACPIVVSLGLLSGSPLIFAAAAVESRTGTPVVRPAASNPSSNPGSNYGTQVFSSTTSTENNRPSTAHSSHSSSAEDRAARMTLSQIETLQKEVGELRGVIETQEHEIKQLKRSQQDLYLDLDRRLNQLTQKPGNNTPNKGSQSSNAKTQTPSKAASNSASAASSAASVAKTASAAGTAGTANLGTEVSGRSVKNEASTNANVSTSKSESAQLSKEQEAYQTAYGFVRTKRYPEAISALQDYLNQFPKGTNVATAHYWLGEVYMVQWQTEKSNPELLDKASDSFTTLSNQFAQHPKSVDAVLKLGIIEVERGNLQAAEQYFTEVKTKHPGTAAARIAEARLQKMAAD